MADRCSYNFNNFNRSNIILDISEISTSTKYNCTNGRNYVSFQISTSTHTNGQNYVRVFKYLLLPTPTAKIMSEFSNIYYQIPTIPTAKIMSEFFKII